MSRPVGCAPCVFPLQPLFDLTGLSRKRFSIQVHANGSDIRKAAEHGCTASQADRWAIRCGYHPFTVWGCLWVDSGLESEGAA